MFDPYLKELHTKLGEWGGKAMPVPNGLDECSARNGNGYIRSWLWQVPGFRRWRVTRLDGLDNLQVLNSVA